MLFERIRKTQKPIFVFLAVTFAMGFVLLGVGQGSRLDQRARLPHRRQQLQRSDQLR